MQPASIEKAKRLNAVPFRQSQVTGHEQISFAITMLNLLTLHRVLYRGADKFLAWPERKQATATEDFDFHISYF